MSQDHVMVMAPRGTSNDNRARSAVNQMITTYSEGESLEQAVVDVTDTLISIGVPHDIATALIIRALIVREP